MPAPVWLLDIDGVVNAASRSLPAHAWPRHVWRQLDVADSAGVSWPIKAAQPVLDFIKDVHDRGRAEIRWHTTWQRDAVLLGRRLGLPDFAVADAPEYPPRRVPRPGPVVEAAGRASRPRTGGSRVAVDRRRRRRRSAG